MRIIGNLLWWLFGGLEAAIGYFTGSLALACTIIGIPFAIQTFKIGLLCLWPFGSTVRETNSPTGCIRIPLNLLWLIFGGLWACLMHLLRLSLMYNHYRHSLGKTAFQDGRAFARTIRQGCGVGILK